MVENGCKLRAFPKKYGNWYTIYIKFNRRVKNGIIQRIFEELQNQNIIDVQGEILCLDSTSVKVHPNAAGARKSSGRSKVSAAQKVASKRYCFKKKSL